MNQQIRRLAAILTCAAGLLPAAWGQYSNWNNPAYDKSHSAKVLERTVFYAPAAGATYLVRWEEALRSDPRVRGVVIHNHGCGGMWGWETHVAQFYYRLGLAVATPEFVTRPGNRTGCPGSNNDSALQGGGENYRAGIFTARNIARMDARTDDVAVVLAHIKSLTSKPIFLSGHSEGARTVYHWDRTDPQIVGAILHNQSCSSGYAHIWRLPPQVPTIQILERNDPWSPDAANGSCGFRFTGEWSRNFTILMQEGANHNPLNNEQARSTLRLWLEERLGGPYKMPEVHNEAHLQAIQRRLYPEAFR